MPSTLAETLGVDPNDADFAAAGEDAHAYEDLVDALVTARKSGGLSQQQVARAMGTTQSAVSDFERLGGDARVSTVQRYARAVGAVLALDVAEASIAP